MNKNAAPFDRPGQRPIDENRRRILKLGGLGIAGVFLTPLLNGCESHTVTPLREPQATPFLTPISEFFEQNGGEGAIPGWTRPTFASESEWSLTVKQGNSTIGTITWDDLMSAAATESVTILKTIECVLQSRVRVTATGFTGNAYWTGVPLRTLLDQVGLNYAEGSGVQRILFSGADGFLNNIKPERILESEAMGLIQPLLVYEMNGRPLPPKHGFPVRLIIQEGFGYKNVKWLTEIQSFNFDGDFGTYQDQGFVDDGIMRVNSRSTDLFDGREIQSGPTRISGFALSGYGPIDRVEISIDGEAPQNAELVPLEEIQNSTSLPPTISQIGNDLAYPFRAVWTPWRLDWEAPTGEHTIQIRAFDSEANVQPDVDNDIADGQNGVAVYTVSVA